MKMLRKLKLKALLFRRHYSSYNYRYHRLNGKRQIRGGDTEDQEGESGTQQISSFRGAIASQHQSHSSSKFLGAPSHHLHNHHHHHSNLSNLSSTSMNPFKSLYSKFSCIKSTACSLPLRKKSKPSASCSSASSSGQANSNVGVPKDIHKGSCAVYVGPEHKRFVMKTCYLEHPVFGVLLQKSEEEFGFEYNGGLLIPCPVAVFEYLLRLLKRNDPSIQSREITQLINSSCISMAQGDRA